MIKKIIAWPVVWSLYYLGDAVSHPMNHFDWGWLYSVYSKLMTTSLNVQDWAGLSSPWKDV